MKSYMTEQENERQKSKLRSWHYSQLHNISDYYPTVASIIINYHQIHRSAFGTNDKKNVLNYDTTSRDDFLIVCLNRECTSIGFNLEHIISDMVTHKETYKKGKLDCEGSEAPDHLYQSCGSCLWYNITIKYNK